MPPGESDLHSSGGSIMNRENKRKTFEKGYYKTHACRDTFTCRVCGRLCLPENAGSDHRNHCPNCLASLHVDVEPGDRASDCGGIMEPVAVWVRRGGEWAIIHRCKRCGALSSNRGQPHEADEHCHEAPVRAAVPSGTHPGDDGSHGRRRNLAGITEQGHTVVWPCFCYRVRNIYSSVWTDASRGPRARAVAWT